MRAPPGFCPARSGGGNGRTFSEVRRPTPPHTDCAGHLAGSLGPCCPHPGAVPEKVSGQSLPVNLGGSQAPPSLVCPLCPRPLPGLHVLVSKGTAVSRAGPASQSHHVTPVSHSLDLDAWINEPLSDSESEDEKPKAMFQDEEQRHTKPRAPEADEQELARVRQGGRSGLWPMPLQADLGTLGGLVLLGQSSPGRAVGPAIALLGVGPGDDMRIWV